MPPDPAGDNTDRAISFIQWLGITHHHDPGEECSGLLTSKESHLEC